MALNAIGRKALLMDGKHGLQRKLARQLGVDEARVSAVVNGIGLPRSELGWKSYHRIQRAVARALDMTVEEAFQDWERGVEEVEESVA